MLLLYPKFDRFEVVKLRIERDATSYKSVSKGEIYMQRKFLEDLGLDKEVIDKIMDENGADIEKTKTKLEAECDGYKTQLETAQNALKEFEGVDVKDLQEEIKSLNEKMTTQATEHQQKIADMEFNNVLDGAITKSGAKNATAIKALLDLETLKASKNQAEDIEKALNELKTSDDYLFTSEEPFKNPVRDTNGTITSAPTKESFAKMSYLERVKLKKENPTKYNELKGD